MNKEILYWRTVLFVALAVAIFGAIYSTQQESSGESGGWKVQQSDLQTTSDARALNEFLASLDYDCKVQTQFVADKAVVTYACP